MLAPDARAILLDQLRPPAGFRLDAAVATTFTLDLAAALVPPLAFAAFEMRGTPDPIAALEAVRTCADRVDVFCQAGQISIPSQASDLMTFLEPMIHEVRRPNPGHLFHPKIWLLRYSDEDGVSRQRLLCMSRNLTRDNSWDTVLRLDGTAGGAPKATNAPLAALIRSLPGRSVSPLDSERRDRILALAEQARRIIWEHPDDVREIKFHVYGMPRTKPDADFRGYRHLIIAPFLTDGGLDRVAPDSPDATVVSRAEDLDQLGPAAVSRIDPYVISPLAGLGEPTPPAAASTAEPDTPQVLGGLHAKIYVVERNRRAHLFLGSANATDAAFTGNVEILVELVGGATKFGIQTFLDETAPFRTLLEHYATDGGAPPDPADEARRQLADLLRDLASLQYTAAVTGGPNEYNLAVRTAEPLPVPDGYRVTAELLTRPGEARVLPSTAPAHADYAGLPIVDITPFVVLRATSQQGLSGGTIVRAHLINDPAGRLDEVLARQVDTPEKFLRFLALLLGLADPGSQNVAGEGGDPWGAARGASSSGLFELVLRALYEHPDALTNLERLVTRLQSTEAGRKVLPDGFDELWTVVIDAHLELQKSKQP